MKVILMDDVDKLGERGQVVSVSPGYARNFLIPKKLANEATPGNVKQFEQRRKQIETTSIKEKEVAEEVARRISAIEITLRRKVGEKDTLYGSVTSADLAKELASQGVEIDKRKIELADHIKNPGTYTVPVALYKGVKCEFKVTILAHEQES